ncbi:ATP-binding protein [Streptomyces sp. NPDC053429]|uniref:ATP-binding protein n=1 Tax=Streptomyces sp. NPDC053429 TaxID=3365702 RepID=UPI0037D29027
MGDPVADVGQAVPAELSSFVGRRRELARAAALLATERLVTLTGPAGVGKTRLAVRAVRTVTGADGLDTVWVDVSTLPGFRRVVLEHRLLHGLAGREVLLVLDGCEQLGEAAAPVVENLLRWLPRVRVLVTSQRRLALPGEAELAVPPLSYPPAPPDPVAPLPVDRIAGFAAVRLYEDRARGADPFFELTDRNAAAVAALCRALDGIPGALELAAGRAHQYAPLQALQRLAAEPLSFLAGGAGRATLVDAERSLRLSSPTERLLWERLSVFAGSFDTAAVAEVCGFGELTPDTAARALARLAPALLADGEHPGRYRLPLSVRVYAARRLAHRPGGDGHTAALRHHGHWRGLAREAAGLWREGAQTQARELALRELPDLRAAMNPLSAAGPGAALEIAVDLWFLWSACGLAAEGRRHLERALALHPAPRPARALWLAAWLVAGSGEADTSDPLLVEAWSTAVQEGEDACLAYLAHVRATVALWEERYEDAAAEYAEALELLPAECRFGPGRQVLRAGRTLALAHTGPTPPEEKEEAAEAEAEATPARGADAWARSWERYARAVAESRAGRPVRARTELLRALETQLVLDDRLGQSFSAELLAELEAARGHYERAALLLGAARRTRPAVACAPRALGILRDRMHPQALRDAYAQGARTALRALLPEL